MTPARMDRLFVLATAGILTLWCGCLVVLWSYAFDSSGAAALLTLAALLVGMWPAMLLPSRLARAARRLFGHLRPRDLLADAGPPRPPIRDPLAMKRLLAFSALFAAVCGLGATWSITFGEALVDLLAESFIWTRGAWLVLGLVVRVVFLLPMGLAVAVAFLVGALVRQGSGRDIYATVFRDWLAGAAAGLAAFAAAWQLGAELLGVAMTMPLVLVAMAVAMFARRSLTVRPRRRTAPTGVSPRPAKPFGICWTFAALAVVAVVQARIASDVFGVSGGGFAWWAGASVAGLSLFLRKEDRRSGQQSRLRELGAVVGLAAGLLMQSAAAIVCLLGGAVAVFCGVLAAGVQAPLCALAAVVLSRQRRTFAYAGGRGRSYMAAACGGAGVGLLVCAGLALLPSARIVLVALALGLLAWAASRAVLLAGRWTDQLRWACCGAALLTATTAGLLASAWRAGRSVGSATPGLWLTSYVTAADEGRHPLPSGVLPRARTRRKPAVLSTLGELLSRPARGGLWWIACSARADVPADMPEHLRPVFFAMDATSVPLALRGRAAHSLAESGFLQAARRSGVLCDGVLLAPLPADHPQAWRCYNQRSLRRCLDRIRPGGALVVRTQAAVDRIPAALAVAGTFRRVVGSGWAVVGLDESGVDILLAGPADAVRRPLAEEGLFVVPIDKMLTGPFDLEPIGLSSPSWALHQKLPREPSLRSWLERIHEAHSP